MLIANTGQSLVVMNLRTGEQVQLPPGQRTSLADSKIQYIDDSFVLISLFNAGVLVAYTDAGAAYPGFPTTANPADSKRIPPVDAEYAAAVVGAALGDSHLLWKSCPGVGRYATASLTADHTMHIQIELESHFSGVVIDVPNLHTATVPGVKVAVAVSDKMGNVNNTDWTTPSTGTWVQAAGDGGDILAARIAAERPSSNLFRANIDSIPRTDGGVRPIIMIRIEYDYDGVNPVVITTPSIAPSGWTATPFLGRLMRHGTQAVLGVTTPASFTTTSVSVSNNVFPLIGYYATKPGRQYIFSGDSNMQGYGPSGPNLSPYWLRALFSQSTVDAPIDGVNAGMHAQAPAVYFARLADILENVSPSVIFYSPYSINGANAGGMTTQQTADVRSLMHRVIDMARQKRCRARFVTGLPCNPAFRDTGSGDALRRTVNAEMLALSSPYLLPAFDAAAVVSGAEDGDGQTLIADAYTSDNVHFLGVAQDALAAVLSL